MMRKGIYAAVYRPMLWPGKYRRGMKHGQIYSGKAIQLPMPHSTELAACR